MQFHRLDTWDLLQGSIVKFSDFGSVRFERRIRLLDQKLNLAPVPQMHYLLSQTWQRLQHLADAAAKLHRLTTGEIELRSALRRNSQTAARSSGANQISENLWATQFCNHLNN